MKRNYFNKAIRGNSDSMIALYSEHKSVVMYLCKSMLLDNEEANEAVVYVFKNTFKELAAGRIKSDEEFEELVISKTILCCKAKLLKKVVVL